MKYWSMRYEIPVISPIEAASNPHLVAVLSHPQLPLPGEMGVATLTPPTASTTPSDEHASAMVASISTDLNHPTVECLVSVKCVRRCYI